MDMNAIEKLLLALAFSGILVLFFLLRWLGRSFLRREKNVRKELSAPKDGKKPTIFLPTDPLPSEQYGFPPAPKRTRPPPAVRPKITSRVDERQALDKLTVQIVKVERESGENIGRFKVVYPEGTNKSPAFFSTSRRGHKLLEQAMANGLMVDSAAWRTLAEITENGEVG